MTLQEAGYKAASWALFSIPGAAGTGLWIIGEVTPDEGWAGFLKSFGVLGALVFYMGWNLIYSEPRREKAHEKVINDILAQHREDRKEDRESHKESQQKLCESIDKNTEAFSKMCDSLKRE